MDKAASDSGKEGFASAGVSDIVRYQSSVGIQERADLQRGCVCNIYSILKCCGTGRHRGGAARVVVAHPSPSAAED